MGAGGAQGGTASTATTCYSLCYCHTRYSLHYCHQGEKRQGGGGAPGGTWARGQLLLGQLAHE